MRPSAPEATRHLFWDEAAKRGAVVAIEGGGDCARELFCSALVQSSPPEEDVLLLPFPHNPQALGRRMKRWAGRAAVVDLDFADARRRRTRPPARTLLLTRTPSCPPDLVVSLATGARREGAFFVPEGCASVRRPSTGEVWRVSADGPFEGEGEEEARVAARNARVDAWASRLGSGFRASPQ